MIEIRRIQEMVRRQLGAREVGPDDHLREHLGAESIDVLNLVTALEDELGIAIEDDELEGLETVRDVHRLVSSKAG